MPFRPVRNRMAISSESLSASGPELTRRSRGRSAAGKSLILRTSLTAGYLPAKGPAREEKKKRSFQMFFRKTRPGTDRRAGWIRTRIAGTTSNPAKPGYRENASRRHARPGRESYHRPAWIGPYGWY